MIKNILLILVGMVVGGAITGGGMYFLYTQSILPSGVTDLGITVSDLPKEDQQKTIDIRPIQLAIPETVVSKKYNTLFQRIINSTNNIAKNNNEVIYPMMVDLQSRGAQGKWEGIFETIAKAKEAINANLEIVSKMESDVQSLQSENINTTKDDNLSQLTQQFTKSGLDMVAAHRAYFVTLSQFLTGKVPTKALAGELNEQILSLRAVQQDFQLKTSSVFTSIDSLASSSLSASSTVNN
jgi:hypothetical protein